MKNRGAVRQRGRERRRKRIRKQASGTPEQPRLTVYRSLKHIYAQLVDDVSGTSLLAASSLSPTIRGKSGELKGKISVAKEVGLSLADQAKRAHVTKVIFDRAGYLYHGRVKAVADGAREGGLDF